MKITAIIQARMGSTRLPGKVLMTVGTETVLARVVQRLRRTALIDGIIVATSDRPADDAIVRECNRLQVACFRGSENDVLDRYWQAAQWCGAEAIVRITSDCPLIDAELVDETIQAFLSHSADYASNALERTYPRGLDAEVFTIAALERTWHCAREAYEREHVTPYIYEHPELFRLVSVRGQHDHSKHRWTLDTAEDLQLIRVIYARFENRDDFGWREVLALMEREPGLAELNSHVIQKAVHA
jgi:spore coat polysaccharide biosynthesis protein SpsF